MHEPIWLKQDELSFPDPEHALKEPNGLLAVGGDLSLERLIAAYKLGIFPWYEAGQPILWWSPDPRMVLFPSELHISKSLNKVLSKQVYKVTFDQGFAAVILACAQQRSKNRDDTWITNEMQQAYINLHNAGWAHSVEVWEGNELVGGLYGIAMGRIFFGESMFNMRDNASKVAFVHLVQRLNSKGFTLIDCQVSSEHLTSLGAREIKREKFMGYLSKNINLSETTNTSLKGSFSA
ncbi:MAG: leucyl/phenylalanyl-tRNA--protein transferase [SAR86 cluster bacterium]|uniref:Leucyl/phenylalanyl-tRNA--protein transferase n=1 Tax=SAR86 cluster bacterium TaxID=2030880 RepID=A0A2A5CE69_9GAMM|nr:MAG: leucyl/phenylalanyl-tRNA--protein transferase [SAR86 cluster bacterium]